MFITKKHLSQRAVLRGAGAALALPFLDTMVPAQTPLQQTAAVPRTRLCAIEMVHGAAGSTVEGQAKHLWSPIKEGSDFDATPQPGFGALEPYKDYLTIVTDTDLTNAMSLTVKEDGADHTRSSAVFLTGAHPKMTEGADIFNGPSIDQIYAQKFGQDTPLPSMQLCIEDVGSLSGACGFGYSCVYANTVSWASPTDPLPMELDPRVAFERLFGAGGTQLERHVRRQEDRSVLDTIVHASGRLQKGLASADRMRLDSYLTDVHLRSSDVFRRSKKYNASGELQALPDAHRGAYRTRLPNM